MKIQTCVCELCRQEACGGRIFRTKSRTGTWATLLFCESDEKLRWAASQPLVHVIRGHGEEWDEPLEEIPGLPQNIIRYGGAFYHTQARLPDPGEAPAGRKGKA